MVFKASNAHDAVRRAKLYGKRAELSYKNGARQTVQLRFVGLIDVISLEGCEDAEAYYSLRRISGPSRHVRADARLSVLADGSKSIGSSLWAVPKELASIKTKRRGRKRGK